VRADPRDHPSQADDVPANKKRDLIDTRCLKEPSMRAQASEAAVSDKGEEGNVRYRARIFGTIELASPPRSLINTAPGSRDASNRPETLPDSVRSEKCFFNPFLLPFVC